MSTYVIAYQTPADANLWPLLWGIKRRATEHALERIERVRTDIAEGRAFALYKWACAWPRDPASRPEAIVSINPYEFSAIARKEGGYDEDYDIDHRDRVNIRRFVRAMYRDQLGSP